MLTQLLERAGTSTLALAEREGVGDQLFEGRELRDLRQTRKPGETRMAIERLLWAVSEATPLLLAVDDVHDLDEASLSLLTALAQACTLRPVMLLLAR